MLAQLTQLLLQKGLAATVEEVADLLWLAGYLDPVVEPKKISTPDEQPTAATGLQDQPATPTVDPSAASTRRTTRTGQSTRRTEVYATQATSESEEEKQAARPVRLPAAPALPGALEISRSLRPLMRRIPSRTRFLLDEINTAQRIADTDDWTPLLRPEPTRWLDVALVVDESASMSMWQRTVIEFYHLLERLGAFRQITLWGVTTSPDGTRMHLHTGIGIAPERIRSRDPRELLDPNNQRLIVVVSDCVSPAWHNNNWPALLVTWGREGLVTLIQMLPPFFWRRTGLRHFSAVLLQTQRAGAPNQDLAAVWSTPRRGQAAPTGIAIPVTTLDPKRLVAWARTIAGDNRIRLPGFMLPLDLEPPSFTPVTTPAPATANSAPSAEQVLATFHTTASPFARQLAGHLAALSSLSLPLIHLVQQVMVREARQTDLAEVMLSGLIRRVTPRDRFDLPADQIEYRFLNEAVRQQLRSTIRISEGDAVHNLVEKLSHYLEARLGQWNDFSAYIVDSSGNYQIARSHQVMARLQLTSLQQALTTPATQSADEIVASANPGQGDGRQQQNKRTTLYALLVGINRYSHFSPALSGCVNDVEAMSGVLQDKFGAATPRLLLNHRATYRAIQGAWSGLIEEVKTWADQGRSGAPPTILFYFSGYGQENLLFTHDSDPNRDHFFIEKQEIERWLRELNEYGAETILILDTCGTAKHIDKRNEADGWRFEQPATVWVAAQKDEGAYEQRVGESTFGVFTYLLVSELERLSPDTVAPLTYADLHSRITQRLQTLSSHQSPRLLGAGDRLLFGGLAPQRERFFHLSQSGDVLSLHGGLLQGLTKGTRLHVYPMARTWDAAVSALGTVHIVDCRALTSDCRLIPSLHSTDTIPATAVALVESYNFRRALYVTIENETLRTPLLSALTVAPPIEMEVLLDYIQVVDQAAAADFIIKNVGESFELLERHGNTLIATYAAEQISQLCADLMHLIPYYNLLESHNKTPAIDLRMTLAIKELSFDPATQAPVGRDLPRRVGGEVLVVQGMRIVFEITNHSAQPLYVTLLGFAYDWSIARLYPGNVDANEAVNAGKTLAIGLSSKRAEQFTLHVPNGLQERQDRFKVIATTIPVDFTHFLQEGLPSISSSQRSYFRSMQSDIELLLLSPSSSHNSGQSITNDWTTAEITVRTVPQGYSEQQTTQLTLDESFYTHYHTYQNFDLLITRSSDGYQAHVIGSPVGEAMSLFSIEAEQFLRKYETSLKSSSNNLTEIQKLGAQLFDALFRNEVLVLLRENMVMAASYNRGLRIHLRFSDTPELASLPWEYLYDQASGRFLALSNATLLTRFLGLPSNQQQAVAQPLKILVALASPQDSPHLNLEAEWQKLQSAMQTQVERGVVVLTRLEKATISALQQQLRQDEYHIFHFAGHGYANSARNEGFLLFEDEECRAHSISSSQLGVLLHSSSSLRLVVLNTSDSAPMAYRLCEQGLMAVVGLQNSFSDVDSIQLTNTFYGSLAAGESVDIALATTRRALYLAGDSSAWGTPVLVSASSDNRLFSLPRRGLRIDPQTSTVWVDGRIVEALTPREFDLLVCLAEEPGKIYETETILTNLYPSGEHLTVESGYVAALVRRVRVKVEPDPSNPQYLLNVRGRGYRLLMEPK